MRSNAVLASLDEESYEPSSRTKKKQKREHAPAPEPIVQKLPLNEINELIVQHTEHGYRLARSFLNRWRVKMSQGETMSVVGVALCEAAHRFDVSKGVSFKTFFFYHLRGMLIKEIIRMIDEQRTCHSAPQLSSGDGPIQEHIDIEHWPSPVVENKTPEHLLQRQQLAKVCWEACADLDELEREVVMRYFVFDQPLNDIASELGYCRCHISRVKSKALALLSKRLRGIMPDYIEKTAALAEQSTSEKASRSARGYTGGRGRRRTEERAGTRKKGQVILKTLVG